MKTLNIFFIFILSSLCYGQINIGYVNEVSEEFIERYYSQRREYNPLQVGNVWQYRDAESNFYTITKVVEDSVINGKHYFKKIYYEFYPPAIDFIAWERNDTTRSGVTFMLDFEDVNQNGDYLEELPIDSLENPFWSEYTTYKYSFHYPNAFHFFPGEKQVHVKDTSWVKIDGDTVISRYFEILNLFWGETIIEKFGIYSYRMESPARICIGAIINGKQYGNIVNIDDYIKQTPFGFALSNNYPNPFNPSTKIRYEIPAAEKVSIKIYDVLGNEIKTLVDEFKDAGYYEVDFSAVGGADNLSSGVYFYRIVSGSFSETKKMVLMR
jgi:hypothetical protein